MNASLSDALEELRLGKRVLPCQGHGHDRGRVRRLLPDYGSAGGDGREQAG